MKAALHRNGGKNSHALASVATKALTSDDLMELVEFTELKDGSWKATLEAGTGGRLMLQGQTLPGVSRAMQSLCTVLALRLEAARNDARQAEGLMRKILSEVGGQKSEVRRKASNSNKQH